MAGNIQGLLGTDQDSLGEEAEVRRKVQSHPPSQQLSLTSGVKAEEDLPPQR